MLFSKRPPRIFAIWSAAAAVGFGVMAIEITSARLLAPNFGASIYVWTSLIVTIMIALSVGYWIGGIVAARGADEGTVGFLLCAAAVAALFGVWTQNGFSVAIRSFLVMFMPAFALLFAGALIVSFLAFAFPVLILAVTSPVLMKLWVAGSKDAGKAASAYFLVSTIGSVVGTVAPTLWLVPLIGSRHTIEFIAAALFLTGAMLLPRKQRFYAAIAVLLIPVTVFQTDPVSAHMLAKRESPYQLVRAYEYDGKRTLFFNEGMGFQTIYDPSGARSGLYYDYFGLMPLLRPPQGRPQDVLVLGLAGGTAVREYPKLSPPGTPPPDFVGVEVDPAVVDIARAHFDLDDLGIEVAVQDGRIFLVEDDRMFDAIIVDAYSVQLYIPPHLATTEFFTLLKKRLRPGGVLAMNVNAPSDDSPLLKTMTNTVAGVFPYVAAVPVPRYWNRVVFASDAPLGLEAAIETLPEEYSDIRGALWGAYAVRHDDRAPVFTDDHAPIETMTDSMILGNVRAIR